MVKKSNIFGIAIMLSLAFTNLNGVFAGDNNLVQLDLHKSSNNAVDLTFFTTNAYQDNIVVRKKSDNKYVILMPKVLTSGYSTPDLSSVKDLITHVDVKSINDSGNGYTKVTLITTKPLDIKTRAQKTAPMTAEQQEYKTLIAEANAVKNNIAKNNNAPKASAPQKTNVTVNKAEPPKKEVKQETVKQKLTEINPEKQEKANKLSDKIQSQTKEIKETITNKKSENKIDELAKDIPDIVPDQVQTEVSQELNNEIKDIKELPQKEKMSLPSIGLVLNSVTSKVSLIIKEVQNKMPVGIPAALTFILIPILGIMLIAKLIKASVVNSKALKESFMNHLAEQPPLLNTLRYNNIVNNKELSWQEKYQRYLDASAKPVSRGPNKGNYTFIKQPAENSIEQKRQNLERLITPDTAPELQTAVNYDAVEVHNEEDAIQDELQRTIKLKAFARNENMTDTLSMSHRDKIKSRFKKYEEQKNRKEKKNVELGDSALHSNPRRMKNSNLNIVEVQALKQRAKEMNIDENDYVMSSVEEFFSLIEKEKEVNAMQEIAKSTNPISSSTDKIRPALQHQYEQAGISQPSKSSMSSPINKQITNPISKLRNETKESYINGLIVKSGFNIDQNKGFYIVNLDGQSALIGRINDEVFVLKKFDKNVDKPIQVRHDNENVYMVKADSFKSLVEVSEDKMGVLIEL